MDNEIEFLQERSWYWIIFKRAALCARLSLIRRWWNAPLSCKVGRHRGFNPNDRGLNLATGIVDYWCSGCQCVAWQRHISDAPTREREDFKDIQKIFERGQQ